MPRAQGTRATMAGTVKDTRGIALPRVTVTIRNLESEADRPAVTATRWHVQRRRPCAGPLPRLDPGTRHRARSSARSPSQPAARAALDIVLSYTVPDFVPVPDRWRLEFPEWKRYRNQDGEYPFVPNRGLDPYDQNVLKGDCRSSATTSSWS